MKAPAKYIAVKRHIIDESTIRFDRHDKFKSCSKTVDQTLSNVNGILVLILLESTNVQGLPMDVQNNKASSQLQCEYEMGTGSQLFCRVHSLRWKQRWVRAAL
ncbi:hypothetical protein GUITHDRAFT_152155 [Guillardia theta CCMP2712]|uniref:Uncharacterized protein n=1 Tax=Guillardia theta (strain CCMP2712) TaxID=905079 RepID=L1JF03_GUITC|nr:hypothetical protein GUITHDRAFT_152155 [Guillardia theta CCMP2712]EKX47081.1 hypothetical protein GUITHDRAFT_152155 [Guillardia theta CCMP2712]|eukprot:XP_005834061.1 hypothetical protein GUITHDRAFT_152155 [Guillardia theta CCMP2712]